MRRRDFISSLLSLSGLSALPAWAAPLLQSNDLRGRWLILVELRGGNDGLNTVIPYADPLYHAMRPRLALKPPEALPLNERAALHPALESLLPIWKDGKLAIVESVGYPRPNLSHFRSIEIWNTAVDASTYDNNGWLTRVFARAPLPKETVADGVVIGANETGPVAGGRAVVMSDPEKFRALARLVHEQHDQQAEGLLRHILKVEGDISAAAAKLSAQLPLKAEFPKGPFGDHLRAACSVLSSGLVPVCHVSLPGFDTHQNQPVTQARLLQLIGKGLSGLRAALMEMGRWDDSLIMTYSEFGRRPRENRSNGTDHGTAAPLFLLGGKVKGGWYGQAPALDKLDENGNLTHAVDFRAVYATILESWWGLPSQEALRGNFRPLPLLAS